MLLKCAKLYQYPDIVEKIGVKKSIEVLDESDLVLLLLNNSEELTEDDKKLIDKIRFKTTIFVINKNDLETKLKIDDLDLNPLVSINTIDNKGIELIKDKIKELFKFDKIKNKDFTYITNIRQITKIKESLNILNNLEEELKNDIELDMLEIDLKDIWNTLGLITGEAYDEV